MLIARLSAQLAGNHTISAIRLQKPIRPWTHRLDHIVWPYVYIQHMYTCHHTLAHTRTHVRTHACAHARMCARTQHTHTHNHLRQVYHAISMENQLTKHYALGSRTWQGAILCRRTVFVENFAFFRCHVLRDFSQIKFLWIGRIIQHL